MRTRLTRGIAVVLVAIVAACGVSTSEQASTATGDEVPYRLLEDEIRATTTTVAPTVTAAIEVWLVSGDGIAPAERQLPRPLSIDDALDALLAGPTEGEQTFGLRSAVTDETISGADVVAGVATVELDESFTGFPPREQLLALAQLTYTVTELSAVQVVSYSLNGVAVEVPRADGSLTNRPVTRADYAALAVT